MSDDPNVYVIRFEGGHLDGVEYSTDPADVDQAQAAERFLRLAGNRPDSTLRVGNRFKGYPDPERQNLETFEVAELLEEDGATVVRCVPVSDGGQA